MNKRCSECAHYFKETKCCTHINSIHIDLDENIVFMKAYENRRAYAACQPEALDFKPIEKEKS